MIVPIKSGLRYELFMLKYFVKVMPTIQQERPELVPKLESMNLSAAEIYAEVTKISKPI